MSELSINWSNLVASTIKNEIGERIIKPIESPDNENQEDGGTIGGLLNLTKRVVNFLFGLASKALSFSFSKVWGIFVNAAVEFWHFNWLITDSSIRSQINQLMTTIASQLGGTLGCSFGQVLCGSVVTASAIVVQVPEAAVVKMLSEASEEVIDEFIGNLSALGATLLNQGGYALGLAAYATTRKLIRSSFLAEYFPPDWISGKSQRSFSFAEKFEDAVASIPNDLLRAFAEEFVEEGAECCAEIGFVMAASLDAEIAKLQQSRVAVLGPDRIVEVKPNRESAETVIIAGPEELVKQQIVNTMVQHSLLENRDIGQLVGTPISEMRIERPLVSPLSLTVAFCPLPDPPFTKNRWILEGNPEAEWCNPRYTIPYVNPRLLSYDRIQRAFRGWYFGRYRAYGQIVPPIKGAKGRKVEVYGRSRNDAERQLRELAELSEGKLVGVGFTERLVVPSEKLSNQHETVAIYPIWGRITSKKLEHDKQTGKATTFGNFSQKWEKFELWPEQEPPYFKSLLKDLEKYYTPIREFAQ